MKRLITIILALILTLFATPKQGADQPSVTTVKTPQAAITTTAEQVPEESEMTAETALVDDVSENETESKTEETAVYVNDPTATETLTVETTMDQKSRADGATEILEETITTEQKEETVECIDKGNQSLAEYKPQIDDRSNPFENDTPTAIDDRPAEDYVGEGEDRPGEGKHF